MKTTSRSVVFIMMVASVLFAGAVSASAATITGTVEGLNCVTHGKACPVDNADPHIATEKAFVVVTGSDSYSFVPNLDRAILARYLHKKVRVTGTPSPKYNAVTAKKFEVNMNGKWKTKWTAEMEAKERSKGMR